MELTVPAKNEEQKKPKPHKVSQIIFAQTHKNKHKNTKWGFFKQKNCLKKV